MILGERRGLNEKDTEHRWMNGNRQGVHKEKRTFAGEVTICVPAGRSSLIGLSREKGPVWAHQRARWVRMDGWTSTRGRRVKKRTEVTNLYASREELAVALTMERRDLHRARRGLSSHPVTN